MNPKDYLTQTFWLDQQINNKLEQITLLRELALKITISLDVERVSGTKQVSPMENAIVKLVDLEHEVNEDIDQLINLKRGAIKCIKSVSQPELNLLLELRYLQYKGWEEIAKRMNYSYRQVLRMHVRALAKIQI